MRGTPSGSATPPPAPAPAQAPAPAAPGPAPGPAPVALVALAALVALIASLSTRRSPVIRSPSCTAAPTAEGTVCPVHNRTRPSSVEDSMLPPPAVFGRRGGVVHRILRDHGPPDGAVVTRITGCGGDR
ncbi:hypothetical protein DEJ31_15305 [Curtobacterium sp. MCPF17_031]|nr:hypothetical protein DEJ31_15305 [Curtobacterium sp. MCPF17_031]